MNALKLFHVVSGAFPQYRLKEKVRKRCKHIVLSFVSDEGEHLENDLYAFPDELIPDTDASIKGYLVIEYKELKRSEVPSFRHRDRGLKSQGSQSFNSVFRSVR